MGAGDGLGQRQPQTHAAGARNAGASRRLKAAVPAAAALGRDARPVVGPRPAPRGALPVQADVDRGRAVVQRIADQVVQQAAQRDGVRLHHQGRILGAVQPDVGARACPGAHALTQLILQRHGRIPVSRRIGAAHETDGWSTMCCMSWRSARRPSLSLESSASSMRSHMRDKGPLQVMRQSGQQRAPHGIRSASASSMALKRSPNAGLGRTGRIHALRLSGGRAVGGIGQARERTRDVPGKSTASNSNRPRPPSRAAASGGVDAGGSRRSSGITPAIRAGRHVPRCVGWAPAK